VRGAGQWHTTVRGANGKGGFFATGSNVQLADLTIAGDVRYRDDANFDAALEGNFGTGSLLHNLWVEHTKVGLWASSGTDGLYVCAGHGAWGISTGPASARLIVDEILGRAPDIPRELDPARFGVPSPAG